ncbi:MAG: glycoside hydrolase family 127 protein, partial [Candidatus Lokiarchaeota archaeon]|nr:glycoside hydrolase family 127 protein [Candidatus Lokiarchaeota archaeon]
IDGIEYTYDNPLVSRGNDKRFEWFRCACCPPNVARTINSIGKYIYSISEKGVWIHQYIGNNTNFELGSNEIKIYQKSGFPWKGHVNIKLNLSKSQKFSIFLRIPSWSIETELKINGEQYYGDLSSGKYVEIIRNWLNNDNLDLSFKMKVSFVKSDQRIKNNRGKVAIYNGPLIYCFEQKDNKNLDIFTLTVKEDQNMGVKYQPEMLGGINTVFGKDSKGKTFTAIPYYAWNNRGADKMQIWHLVG